MPHNKRVVIIIFLYKKWQFLNFFKGKIYTKTHQIASFKRNSGESMPPNPLARSHAQHVACDMKISKPGYAYSKIH